jgi:hypothetical protein
MEKSQGNLFLFVCFHLLGVTLLILCVQVFVLLLSLCIECGPFFTTFLADFTEGETLVFLDDAIAVVLHVEHVARQSPLRLVRVLLFLLSLSTSLCCLSFTLSGFSLSFTFRSLLWGLLGSKLERSLILDEGSFFNVVLDRLSENFGGERRKKGC